MQMEVKLIFGNPVEAVQVMATLGGLANTLQGLQADVAAFQQPPQAPAGSGIVDAQGHPATTEGPAVVEGPKYADVEQALQRYAKRHGIPAVKEVLAALGVERARQLKPEQWADFIARCTPEVTA
jgi:hypothetical protein